MSSGHDLSGLSRSALFRDIDIAALRGMAGGPRSVSVPAGRVICCRGDAPDGCFVILKGAVKVWVKADDGQEILLSVLGEGDIFGEMALLDRLPRSATVTALKACELCHLSTPMFERLADINPALSRRLQRILSVRLRAANEAVLVQQMPLQMRLARVLLQLAQRFGEHLPDERVLIRQRLSQAELGRMAGGARENVNRQLNEWRRARLVTRLSGYYCIEQPQAFEALVEYE